MESPKTKLLDRQLPIVQVDSQECDEEPGTEITVTGYNNNRRDVFTHDRLKDYIKWFTKVGSIEREFGVDRHRDFKLILSGIDKDGIEELSFGHFFPEDSKSVSKLFDEHLVQAPRWYCKKIIKRGNLKHSPEIRFEAIFCVEGTRIKHSYNPMISRSGYSAPEGAYNIQSRYGLWLCKDYIPVQRKNEWITHKGSEYTRFHAFVNCQDLRLTANRGAVDNTPSEIINDLQSCVEKIFNEIINGNDWSDLDWLESETEAYTTTEKEKSDFKRRIDRVKASRIADYNNIRLVEPHRESGVFSIFMQLESMNADLFPFKVIDYDTHSGYDVIVKSNDNIPIVSSKLFYVEFKNYLGKQFNHSFENLHSIVCWDIDPRNVKSGDEITDIAGMRRTLKVIQCQDNNDYTRHFLDDMRSDRKIEIFVLKRYLEEKCGITFRIRTEQDAL